MKSQMLAYDNSGPAGAANLYRQKYYSTPVDRMHARQYNYNQYQNDLSYSPAAWNKLTTSERTNVIYEKCKMSSHHDTVDIRRLQGRDSFRCDDILKIAPYSQPSSYPIAINGDTSAIVASSPTAKGIIMDTVTV
ncbi:hypothetical protein [Trichoplusia ni single nucleopolyhedrovirus]|uniref:Uncharacterized protein n=1 Tax=Trichoplusia ni single nucleopolyhedrovirus TaxID=332054 RepID=Q461T9_9ABAC|nr:hypothetical protein TNSV_gp127 [Trichoplusia ni single nucleopolyhedrovirus]AAZ67497.1 hypothetical protein [Trichoplusia ni single nucleopolyhedrovirus]